LAVDLESEHPKMAALVEAVASRSADLLAKKRWLNSAAPASATRANPAQSVAAPSDVTALDKSAPAYESSFLKACRREPVATTPIWLMRQAGRYLPEYRALREKVGFLELCKNPALCAEVMISAVKRLGVDAAIIFSDLLPILEPMGMELEFSAGEGPVIHNPVRQARGGDRVLEMGEGELLSRGA